MAGAQVLEDGAAVEGPIITLNGSFCTQMKAWRIVALYGDRASTSGSALEAERQSSGSGVGGMRGQEGLVATLNGTFCAQVQGTADHLAGWRPGERSRRYLSRFELQVI